MLDSGSTRKYMLYALGEIALVVIGILIALQINNWNEQRSNRHFEIRMLKEIKAVLGGELSRMDMITTRMKILDSTVYTFLPLAENDELLPKELVSEVKRLNIGISFEHNAGPYSSIKNQGLDKISNDSLRTALVHFYDYQYPRFVRAIQSADSSYPDHRKRMRQFGITQSIVPETGEFYHQRDIPKEVLQSEGFDDFLLEVSERANMVLYRVHQFRPILKEMLESVGRELGG